MNYKNTPEGKIVRQKYADILPLSRPEPIKPDKVKSSTESIESIESRSQLYDLTYGPSVIDSEATSSPKTKDTTATDIQKSLRFLFGEEE